MKQKITFLAVALILCGSILQAQTPAGLVAITPSGVEITSVSGENISTNNKRMVTVGNKLFFSAKTSDSGEELWMSDGTLSGTKMVKDIVAGANGSNPQWLCAVGNKCFFSATTATEGSELWVSDGTEAGTVLIKDIYSGSSSSTPINITAFGDKVLFFAMDEISELIPVVDNTIPEKWLWISDGTDAGTINIGETPTKETGYDGDKGKIIVTKDQSKAFFIGYSSSYNETLWITDGTKTGTKPIKDINPKPFTGWASTSPAAIDWMTLVGNKLVFRAETVSEVTGNSALGLNGDIGSEIWVSDGTASGTNWIGVDYAVGMSGATPFATGFAATLPLNDNLLLFRANDGVHGVEATVMDLSKPFVALTNPKMVQDYNNWNFPAAAQPSWPQGWRTVYNGFVYFQANGWISGPVSAPAKHGTAQSLTRIDVSSGDIAMIDSVSACTQWTPDNYTIFSPQPNADNCQFFTKVGDLLYFTAQDAANNNELWYMDASAYPKKYCDFTDNGTPHSLRMLNDKLYFIANSTKTLYQVGVNTGVSNIKLTDINIYPNPVSDVLNIKSDKSIKNMDLYDTQGRLVLHTNGNQKTINLSVINLGIYFLKISLTSGETSIEKIVKN